MRQAELLALRWRDINVGLAFLSISQTLHERRGVCIFKKPKPEHSRRKVDMTPGLALFLRQYRTQKEGERLLLGMPLMLDDLVFSNIDGKPIDPGTLTHSFARIARKADLSGTRFHDLQRYSHLLSGIQKAAMGRLGEMLSPAIGETKMSPKRRQGTKPAKGIEPLAGGLRNSLQNLTSFLDSVHNMWL